jgi:pyruvate/2-oxoglutarate dehydrogenase complex dihydrolipoamide acyltransferase (E2) component
MQWRRSRRNVGEQKLQPRRKQRVSCFVLLPAPCRICRVFSPLRREKAAAEEKAQAEAAAAAAAAAPEPTSAPAPPPAPVGQWVEYKDPQGRPYYYNVSSHRWVAVHTDVLLLADVRVAAAWMSTASQTATKATVWEAPVEGYIAAQPAPAPAPAQAPAFGGGGRGARIMHGGGRGRDLTKPAWMTRQEGR